MAQKVKIALLPCPCCGGSAEYTETSLPDAYSDHEIIACTECHLQMDNASPQEWNRRVQSAQQSMHLTCGIQAQSQTVFYTLALFLFTGFFSARPHAANASRWAALAQQRSLMEEAIAIVKKYRDNVLGMSMCEQIQRAVLNSIIEDLESAQQGMHSTLLPVRRKLVSCPNCKLVFGVDSPVSQSE